MKKISLLFFLALHMSVRAQDEPQSFSLKQAIDYALEQNFSVKNAQLEKELALAKKGEARGMLLPQISGKVDYTYSPQIQKNIFENGVGLVNNTNTPLGTVIPVQFALANQLLPSLNASQVIFDQSYFTAQGAAKVYDEIAEKNITKDKIDAAVNVIKAYYGVLVNEQQLVAINKNLERMDSLYSETNARFESGLARNIDVSRIQVSLNNMKEEKERVSRNVNLSRSVLRYHLNLSESNPLALTDQLDETEIASIQASLTQDLEAIHENRIEYSIINSQLRFDRFDLKNASAGRYPTLMASATIGYNPAATYLSNITQSERWQTYSMVGLHLNIPIFSGFTLNSKIKQKQIQQRITENNKLALEKEIDLEVEQALINLNNSMQSYRIQKDNIALAQENLRVLQAEYEQGIALNIEVITAEADLIDAQTNFYTSIYNTLIAKADYDKATGNILK